MELGEGEVMRVGTGQGVRRSQSGGRVGVTMRVCRGSEGGLGEVVLQW